MQTNQITPDLFTIPRTETEIRPTQMQFDPTSGTKCEVYSSLTGVLFEISVSYQERNALFEFEKKTIIKLPEYGLMPATETRLWDM